MPRIARVTTAGSVGRPKIGSVPKYDLSCYGGMKVRDDLWVEYNLWNNWNEN